MSVADLALERITLVPEHAELSALPWPTGQEPRPAETLSGDTPPTADVLIVTYTTAEAEALADVLTPGVHRTQWIKYRGDWDWYEKQLTDRSPAHEEGCVAHWWVTNIGQKRVVVAKSELHLATDATSLPVKQLWKDLITAIDPSLIITTGTAGGIGLTTVLGDVLMTGTAKFNCTQAFKDEPYAQTRYQQSATLPAIDLNTWTTLTTVNASHLQPVATRNPMMIIGADVETVDYFAFADATDSYGVVKNDPRARVEEMDDACLPLALAELTEAGHRPVQWLSIRNASDPQVPHMDTLQEEKTWAADIYAKYGYWTTVPSAITCWAVIAN